MSTRLELGQRDQSGCWCPEMCFIWSLYCHVFTCLSVFSELQLCASLTLDSAVFSE